jgi:hypothetical protein
MLSLSWTKGYYETLKSRITSHSGVDRSTDNMPYPLITFLENVVPWNYVTWTGKWQRWGRRPGTTIVDRQSPLRAASSDRPESSEAGVSEATVRTSVGPDVRCYCRFIDAGHDKCLDTRARVFTLIRTRQSG